jgi:hypothetical protein
MEKKTYALLLSVLLIGVSFGYCINPIRQHVDPKINVYLEIVKGDTAGVQSKLYAGNLITDIGERYVRNHIGFDNQTLSGWSISVSNDGTPLVTWTKLPNEVTANGFTRGAGDVTAWVNSGDYAFNVTEVFTATGTQQLQTAGLNWDPTSDSDNNLFAAADFTQTTFNADDTLTATYVITKNAN